MLTTQAGYAPVEFVIGKREWHVAPGIQLGDRRCGVGEEVKAVAEGSFLVTISVRVAEIDSIRGYSA